MHVHYPRAAVATGETPSSSHSPCTHSSTEVLPASRPRQVLWASPALAVRAGRLVGVRLFDQTVEVALVRPGADRIQWVMADEVLNEYQVAVWLRTSAFAP